MPSEGDTPRDRIEAQVIRKQHPDTNHDALGVLLCQLVAVLRL